MALQVWLPLNGDIHNQGILNKTFTNDNVTWSAGKLGNCATFSGSNNSSVYADSVSIGNTWTVCCWAKATTDHSGYIVQLGNAGTSAQVQFGFRTVYQHTDQLLWLVNTTGTTVTLSGFVSTNWNHIAMSYDGAKARVYLNGTLASETAHTASYYEGNRLSVGRYYSGTSFTGQIQDFRLYDHVLIAEEIKKISRGLVAHYPLSDIYNASNLIYNGFGAYGSSGWDGTTASTSDLPSDSAVKASFVGGSTSGLIPVNVNNTFTVSCYVKTSGETSGTAYPSILPYDADKKFISNYHCPDGFNTSWSTTLAQPLKKGDTVIYATDLSAWSTATNNYYYVAVFGYEDGQGNVYPDFTYTQDSLSFGSYSDKSKLNKTNNTITLNSAYAGKDRPAGTKICQATAGSNYFYPFGGISLSSITNWTAKTATFSFYSQNRLRYAKYIKWSIHTSYSVKFAGVKISDNTWETSTLYDVSGFGYNLSKFGDANVSYTSNTPRYRIATSVDTASNSGYSLSVATQGGTSVATLSAWVYETARSGGDRDLVINNGRYITIKSTGVLSTYAYGKSPAGYHDGTTVIPLNTWTHLAVVWDDNYVYGYVNGVQDFKIACTGNFTSMANTYLLGEPNNTRTFHGYVSDVRFYSTAFSADDVLKLYHGIE